MNDFFKSDFMDLESDAPADGRLDSLIDEVDLHSNTRSRSLPQLTLPEITPDSYSEQTQQLLRQQPIASGFSATSGPDLLSSIMGGEANSLESTISLAGDQAVTSAEFVSESPTGEQNLWGLNEGVGTGELPPGIGSCGCGVCGPCTGGGADGAISNFGSRALATVDLQQVVFLDFDTGTDGSIDYTPAIRDAIQLQMEIIYESFGVTFVQTQPTDGDFSTLVFNAGTPGGLAEDIDFRNLNRNDNAVINIDGMPISDSDSDIIFASANIGAHELGHILGLRHHDAFGTIGAGVPAGLGFLFGPSFTGPTDADETTNHILNTPALAGAVSDVLTPSFLGEREAIKLAFAAIGTVVNETAAPNDTFVQAQEIELQEILVPNTILFGENEDAGDFLVDAISVSGSFGAGDPVDIFEFEGEVGRAYSFEVISSNTDRLDDVDVTISIFDSDFQLVDYFGSDAFNDDDPESFDAFIIDLQFPENGTYFAQVDTAFGGVTGQYELFIQSFAFTPFNVPAFDDHTDFLVFELATDLEFDVVGEVNLARADGIIGFAGEFSERDVFDFTIDSAARVIIDVRATSDFFNGLVELFDSDDNLIAFNDDNNNPNLENPLDSQFIIPNLPAGDYNIAVSGSSGSVGAYRLGVRHSGVVGSIDDHGDTFLSATNVALNPLPQTTFINASAEFGGDDDFFVFTANTTGRVIVRSLGLSGDINTVLRGFNADRQILDANNNFNGTLNSRIGFDVVQGESYFLRLNTVGNTSGDYRLSIRTVPESSGFNPNAFVDSGQNVNLRLNDTGAVFDEFLAGSDLDFSRPNQVDQFGEGGGILA